jgi:2-polyprenyl-3-methyl-5-hydroxy-6-metoxy-1,4-benzoquinol methylase
MNDKSKTTQKYWENEWNKSITLKLPSIFNASIWNLKALITNYASAGINYIEIGCAPGKLLAWTAWKFKANVSGLDYSDNGMRSAKELFSALDLQADLRCEDLFQNSFLKESFDLVTSFGLIEHFENPLEVIQKHIELLKPGGVAVIAIPNYGGIYGQIQKKIDKENLLIHNLKIMTPLELSTTFIADNEFEHRTFYFGKPSIWILSLNKIFDPTIAKVFSLTFSLIVSLFPKINKLSPLIVLEVRRKLA